MGRSKGAGNDGKVKRGRRCTGCTERVRAGKCCTLQGHRGGCPAERSVHAMPGDKALPNLANLAPRSSTKRDRASRVLYLPLQASAAP